MENGFLLVKSLKDTGEDKKSGIYLPVEKDDEFQTSRCEILLVPEGSKYKVGEVIFFSKLVPDNVMIAESDEEVELWFILETDVKMTES